MAHLFGVTSLVMGEAEHIRFEYEPASFGPLGGPAGNPVEGLDFSTISIVGKWPDASLSG
jgi:hypothetical protein